MHYTIHLNISQRLHNWGENNELVSLTFWSGLFSSTRILMFKILDYYYQIIVNRCTFLHDHTGSKISSHTFLHGREIYSASSKKYVKIFLFLTVCHTYGWYCHTPFYITPSITREYLQFTGIFTNSLKLNTKYAQLKVLVKCHTYENKLSDVSIMLYDEVKSRQIQLTRAVILCRLHQQIAHLCHVVI